MGFSLTKASLITLVLGVTILLSYVEGRDHLVGGTQDAWKVPSSNDADLLAKWSSKSRFQIGDNLVWKYDSKKDSVLQVTREAYMQCNTTNTIAEMKNDETKVALDKSGPHYFISGVKENCDKGEKVIVVVMSPRNRPPSGGIITPSVAPSPSSGGGGIITPSVAPSPSSGLGTGGAVGIKAGLVGFVGVLFGFLFM